MRKGGVLIHVDFGQTADLVAENIQIRNSGRLEISLDLNKNLRTRNKQENSYIDALALSKDISQLRWVQLFDDAGLEKIAQFVESQHGLSECWLLVELSGSHAVRVRPEFVRGAHLFLHVLN